MCVGGHTVKARDLRSVNHVVTPKDTFSLRHGDESICVWREGIAAGDVFEDDELLLVLRQLVTSLARSRHASLSVMAGQGRSTALG